MYDFGYIKMMTIRKCIEQLRRYSSNQITLNNGTKIYIHEMYCRACDEPFSTIKWNEDGTVRVIRRIFCSIKPNSQTKMLDEIQSHRNKEWGNHRDYWMFNPDDKGYQYFNDDDYIIPERVMNSFIASNGGIDEYETIQVKAYMYDDMMALAMEMEKDMED